MLILKNLEIINSSEGAKFLLFKFVRTEGNSINIAFPIPIGEELSETVGFAEMISEKISKTV